MSDISKALGLDAPSKKPLLTTLNAVGHVAEAVASAALPAAAPVIAALQGTPTKVESTPLPPASASVPVAAKGSGFLAEAEAIITSLDPHIGTQIDAVIVGVVHRVTAALEVKMRMRPGTLKVAEDEIDLLTNEGLRAVGLTV